jgi:hypothetical protein
MYKGNMGDFVSKVDVYLRKHYDCKIIFGRVPIEDVGKYFVAFYAPSQRAAIGYEVFDKENFEEQIYDYVNKELSDVQGKHDGFPELFDGLFEEDVPYTEDEDSEYSND